MRGNPYGHGPWLWVLGLFMAAAAIMVVTL
jgi:hypothetical protein